MDVPAVLREAMELTGWTQVQLAKKAGVAQGTISKWLSAQQSPNKAQWDDVTRLIARTAKIRHLVTAEPSEMVRAPLLSWVSAGGLADAQSQIPVEDVPLLAFADLGHGDFFALRVAGDSMDRVSPDGSVIVVNRADRELVPDRPYIFSRRGEATFKLWQPDPARLEPHSWNGAHKPIYLKGKRDFEVVGRVKRTVLDL